MNRQLLRELELHNYTIYITFHGNSHNIIINGISLLRVELSIKFFLETFVKNKKLINFIF